MPTETSIVSERVIKPLEKRLNIKADLIDREASFDRKMATVYGMIAGEIPLLFFLDSNYPLMIPLIGASGLTGLAMAGKGKDFIEGRFIKKGEKEETTDLNLGYKAKKFVYRGKNKLDLEGFELAKGDNIAYVALPSFTARENRELTPKDVSVMVDATELSIQEIKNFFKDYAYKAVCVDFGSTEISDKFPSEHKTTAGAVMAGKGAYVKKPETQLLVFTREEFESLSTTPQKLFKKACDALGDPQFSELLDQYRNAKTPEERKKGQNIFRRRLNHILLAEVSDRFNGPEVVHARTASYAPEKVKRYKASYIKELQDNLFWVTVSTDTGAKQSIPLEDLLKTRNQPIEDIIASGLPIRKAQLACVIHQMIKESSLEKLVEERRLDRADVLKRLQNLGLSPGIRGIFLNEPHVYLTPLRIIRRNLRTVLASALASSIISTGYSFVLPPNSPDSLIEALEQPAPIIRGAEQSPGFSDRLPKHSLEWAVDAREGFNPYGMYITDTARVFKDGKWEINKNRVKKIENIPPILSIEGSRAFLTKRIALNPIGETSFKVPTKDHSRLSALKLSRLDGGKIDHTVWEHDDGTVEVVIPGGVLGGGIADVIIVLAQDEKGQVHAVGKAEPPLDENELTDRVRFLLKQAEVSSNSGEDIPQSMSQLVAAGNTYSLNPPNGHLINEAKNGEEYVNKMEEVRSCKCDVCNTQAVLAGSALPGDFSYNIAFGFLNQPGNLESFPNDSFLQGENLHAIGIDGEGRVPDATATSLAEDALTKAFFELQQKSSEQTKEDKLREWNAQADDVAKKAAEKQDLINKLKLFGALATTTSGFFLARQGSRFIRRVNLGQKAEEVTENVVMSMFSGEEFRKAYNFLAWVSFGKNKVISSNLEAGVSHKNKKEILKAMRGNVDYEKLSSYLKKPTRYDKRKAISTVERMKFRALARYLMR
ncbi:MAG: hypothetical protein Q7K55_01855 [Candidatus Levybacteria bacterium]|nr:hypothetical protein [Candidatus Levybacteria bacterium]